MLAPRIPQKLQSLSDEVVVRRILDGETELFEIIMRRYNGRLYRVARSILRDDTEAEDIMQDAYLRAYEHLDQFDGRASFATWLTKIAVYAALGRMRRRSRLIDMDVQDESGVFSSLLVAREPGPEQSLIDRNLFVVLEAEIDKLPQIYRSVYMMREIEKMSTNETAECLNISADSVKVRLHRARALLRAGITQQFDMAAPRVFDFMATRCDRVVDSVLNRMAVLRQDRERP